MCPLCMCVLGGIAFQMIRTNSNKIRTYRERESIRSITIAELLTKQHTHTCTHIKQSHYTTKKNFSTFVFGLVVRFRLQIKMFQKSWLFFFPLLFFFVDEGNPNDEMEKY